MSDLYSELLVKKERTAKDRLVKGSIIALIVLLVLAGLFIMPLLLIAAIVLGVCAYLFIFPGTDLEFEYLFVNGELDIDKIMAKSKRKRVKSLNITECDIMAPINSHRMDYYNSNQKLQVQDFSSENPEHKRFAIHVNEEKIAKQAEKTKDCSEQELQDIADVMEGTYEYSVEQNVLTLTDSEYGSQKTFEKSGK